MEIASRRGSTFVENLVALFLLTVGLVFASSLFFTSMRVNAGADDDSVAAGLAQQKMEELKTQVFSSLAAGGGLDPANPVAGYWETSDPDADGKIDFDILWKIEDDLPEDGMKAITVRAVSRRSEKARIGSRNSVTLGLARWNDA